MISFIRTHPKAFKIILLAAALDTFFGWAYSRAEHLTFGLGMYWSIQTATTVGYGDLPPKTTLGHWICVGVFLTIIPMFAAVVSLFTAKMTTEKVQDSHDRIIRHLEHHAKHHGIPPMDNEDA